MGLCCPSAINIISVNEPDRDNSCSDNSRRPTRTL